MARAIMIQGTGSNVGKSMLVAGILRAARARSLTVRPFKPQNMSNNAAVTEDGGEIGRAQALQALAAGVSPHSDMNPILLKPESDRGAQVILQGRVHGTLMARDYAREKPNLLAPACESFRRLASQADLVVIEGAGSPAEINLRRGDIANMGFAEAMDLPVALFGDIERGGVIAQLVGTSAILPEADRDRIKAFGVNKFRGDPRLFDDGLHEIEARTGWPSLGVIPWFDHAWQLPAEDILDLEGRPGGDFKIAVPQLSRIANFDDLDPLAADPAITVDIVPPGRALPGDASLVLIPGSKTTRADLAFFRAQGWDIDLQAHLRRGGHVLGICGGYQMLGQSVADPEGLEGPPGETPGLGLLNVTTVMERAKHLTRVQGQDRASGAALSGYEIHLGHTDGPDCDHAWIEIGTRAEGAASPDGHVRGTYLHGLFHEDGFRAAYLARLGARASDRSHGAAVERALDDLAAHLEQHMDIDQLLELAAPVI
ncbi:MAG: cobyric acid synthase [Mangrovicoccus sp.]|nr:cobyric acid synthase [Mangrovicoccus sp.]